LIGQWDKVFVV
jgi:transposase InsO family protein